MVSNTEKDGVAQNQDFMEANRHSESCNHQNSIFSVVEDVVEDVVGQRKKIERYISFIKIIV